MNSNCTPKYNELRFQFSGRGQSAYRDGMMAPVASGCINKLSPTWWLKTTHLFPDSLGVQKSKPKCRWGCVVPRGFSRESISLDYFLASSTACIPLACNLFPESLQSLVSVVSSPTLSLTLLPPSYKHSHNYIGPTWRTLHNHPIPKSYLIHTRSPFCHIR